MEDIAFFGPRDLVHVPGKGWRLANWNNNLVFWNPEKDRKGFSLFNGRMIYKLSLLADDPEVVPEVFLSGLEPLNQLFFGQEEGPVHIELMNQLEKLFGDLRQAVQERRQKEVSAPCPVLRGMLPVPRGPIFRRRG